MFEYDGSIRASKMSKDDDVSFEQLDLESIKESSLKQKQETPEMESL